MQICLDKGLPVMSLKIRTVLPYLLQLKLGSQNGGPPPPPPPPQSLRRGGGCGAVKVKEESVSLDINAEKGLDKVIWI